MSRTLSVPQQIDTSDFITKPGKYHLLIKAVSDGTNFRGDAINGFALEVAAQAGPEVDKDLQLIMFDGDLSHNDKGEFANKRQAAFLIAANVITPDQLGKDVEYNIEQCVNHQICAELVMGQTNAKGKAYLQFNGLHIYHIDDPRAKDYPKNKHALEFAKDFRRPAEFFAKLMPKKASTVSNNPRISDDSLKGL